ncbi:MAG: S1C family serine protease [Acidimicrobiia bacterium]
MVNDEQQSNGEWSNSPSAPPYFGATMLPPPPNAPSPPMTPPAAAGAAQPAPTPQPGASKRANNGGWGVVVVTGLISALIAALVAGGLVFALKDQNTQNTTGSASSASSSSGGSSTIIRSGDIQAILAKEEPSVVAIRTGGAAGGTMSQSGGAGTGFVVSSDGYIVTNNHVIADAGGKISVAFADGKTRSATVIGADPTNDLAVIKVDATGLPVSTLGNSKDLKVGDDVVAIGNALALDGGPSVTRGIVSALGRSISTNTGSTLSDLIQTDAAINPGNSGGPLVNAEGNVIGINTAAIDPAAGQNIGFAIPIDAAKPIIEELKQGKDRRPGFLGVRAQTLTPAIANQLGSSLTTGAVVQSVTVDSPAEKAGLQRSDIITEVDGKAIKTREELTTMISSKRPGDKVTIAFERSGKKQTASATLTVRPG